MSREEIEQRIVEISRRHGLTLDRTAKVERLSVGEQQHVELIKTLIGNPRILILDEPAALLSADEVEKLWLILRDLAGQGVGIILIGHKLDDVLAIADRITVLRHGRVVATVSADDVNAAQLGDMMIGSLAAQTSESRLAAPAPEASTALEVRRLSVSGDRAPNLVKDISFSVKSGEVLGIAGIIGSGQAELLEAIMGIRPSEWRHSLIARRRHFRPEHSPAPRARVCVRPRRPASRRPDRIDERCRQFGAQRQRLSPSTSRSGILNLKSIETRARTLMKRFGISAAGAGRARCHFVRRQPAETYSCARTGARPRGRSVLLPDPRIGLRLDRGGA